MLAPSVNSQFARSFIVPTNIFKRTFRLFLQFVRFVIQHNVVAEEKKLSTSKFFDLTFFQTCTHEYHSKG